MRSNLIGRLARSHHCFAARDSRLISLAALRCRARRWLRHATDRAIGAATADLRFNPFVFIVESGP